MTSIVECRDVTKAFGGPSVVDRVDLDVARGSVHSLVGANGAGKSTLLGIISGRLTSTQGTVYVDGAELIGGNPKEARRAGVSAVYQELTVLPAMTAVANVFLGQEEQHGGVILDQRSMKRRFAELCTELAITVDPDALARDLSLATSQMLEIMRAIQAKARVILFDEPTAALSERERRTFLELIRTLRSRGTTIILVTHNLDEVLEVSDVVTVMRGGRKVGEGPVSEWDKRRLVHAMTGESPLQVERDRHAVDGPVLLEIGNLVLPGVVHGVDLFVREGEVLGLAGLVGAGRSSILRSIAGAEGKSSGNMSIRGHKRAWPRSVRRAVKVYGFGLVPEERKVEGLVLTMSLPDNVTMADLGAVSIGPFVQKRRQFARAVELLRTLTLSRPVGEYPVGSLSGGNQQKAVLAKWFHRDPQLLLVDEPTRGIDVAAKVEVLAALRDVARRGKAVIMTSAETEEVLDVCDRVLVIVHGRIAKEYDMHKEKPTVKDVLDVAFGVQS